MLQLTLKPIQASFAALSLLFGALSTTSASPRQIGPVAAGTVYVSPTGADNNPGTLAAPFLTLDHARLAVQSSLPAATGDTRIVLRGGTYTLAATLTLTAADSGQNGNHVVYAAYPGEHPVLSGGQAITGWTLHDSAKNIWQASVPAGLALRQLFVNGVRCQRARSTSIPSGTAVTSSGYTWGDSSLASLARPQDVEMVQDNAWTESRCPVASVSGATVTMQTPAWTYCETKPGVSLGVPTWAENAYEFLTQPGQFYFNPATSILSYIPRPGETLTTATVIAPALQTLLSSAGTAAAPVRNVRVQGVAFEYAAFSPPAANGFAEIQANICMNAAGTPACYNGYPPPPAAVQLAGCQGVTLLRCLVARTGGAGIALGYGCQASAVQGCVVTDTGGNGIEIGDPTTALHSDARAVLTADTVTDNWVHDCGQEFRGGVGIVAWYTSGLTVSHNQINSLPYTGLSCGWGWGNTVPSDNSGVTISQNLIYSVNQALNDGGGIYLNSVQAGLLVWGNVIHDVPASNGGAGGAAAGGLYTDNGSRYDTLQGNVVYNTPGFNVHNNDNRGDTLIQFNTLDAGNRYLSNKTTTASGAGPDIYQNNFTAPASSDPLTVQRAGLEPGFRDLLTAVIP